MTRRPILLLLLALLLCLPASTALATDTTPSSPQTIESVTSCSLVTNIISNQRGVVQVQDCVQHLPSEYRNWAHVWCFTPTFHATECNVGGNASTGVGVSDLYYNATRVVHSCCPSGVGIGAGVSEWIVRSGPAGCTTAKVHGVQRGMLVRLTSSSNPLDSSTTAVSSTSFSAGGC